MALTRSDGSFEIYIQIEGKYCLTQVLDLPDVMVEVADFNRDGQLDLIYTQNAALFVNYNTLPSQGPKQTSLCNPKPNLTAPFTENPIKTYDLPQDQPLQDSMPGVPGRLRIADIEMDGFPDVVLTLATPDGATETRVLTNSQGEVSKRTLKEAPAFDSAIREAAGTDAALVTFIDIDEDGKLDFLIQSTDATLKLIYNNVYLDNFFIKALMLQSKQEKSENVYGDTIIGASYRFVITDLEDEQAVVVGVQQSQSGFLSLQLPYAFMGVGRSNNYVETFFAGSN